METPSQPFSLQISTVVVLLALFALLVAVIPTEGFIVVLNGLFLGAMVSILLAFGSLILGSMFGSVRYGRVQRMSVGIGWLWMSINAFVVASTYLRFLDYHTNATYVGSFGRYAAIVAASHMVTAPDYGLGIFYGRDRRLLWVALAIGMVVSAVVVYLQLVPMDRWLSLGSA